MHQAHGPFGQPAGPRFPGPHHHGGHIQIMALPVRVQVKLDHTALRRYGNGPGKQVGVGFHKQVPGSPSRGFDRYLYPVFRGIRFFVQDQVHPVRPVQVPGFRSPGLPPGPDLMGGGQPGGRIENLQAISPPFYRHIQNNTFLFRDIDRIPGFRIKLAGGPPFPGTVGVFPVIFPVFLYHRDLQVFSPQAPAGFVHPDHFEPGNGVTIHLPVFRQAPDTHQ